MGVRNVSPGEGIVRVTAYLQRQTEPVTILEITRKCGLSRTSAESALRTLERSGLVTFVVSNMVMRPRIYSWVKPTEAKAKVAS